ncbi:type VI secretion system baseplate subunit TssE [Edwardsiella anguillarum]|uniref:type VI secretion system baseplate subunit TssE n=1 Tax=Edwardsiella TaxID=635 RepID=UPI00045D08D0|nr:type VI secretion system baseplate subunit TssE [Edwardsiella anguillarum]AKM47301.1 type VI secretion protein [Edwardsiella sp. EA181011]GAJ65957.1 type VI secretion system protein EvpE [Edwardsiella piscicida]RFT02175.1 type VI secretion protein [Edwardsiella anguillarum]BET81452.1 type VI secretion system baseplate subunit TssE [Edwardsiella anguillarum]BET84879.1 type VI secretion system baseplate subunit TssE [Edwardsiella anguillarum]
MILHHILRPSVLDRLFDDFPQEGTERTSERRYDLAHFHSAVRRDVENVLNTRSALSLDTVQWPELEKSPLNYGLPDCSNLSAANAEDREWIRQHIERAIDLFEPRLSQVRVQIYLDEKTGISQLIFRIEALLEVDPTPEPVMFDAVLDVSTQLYRIDR